MKVMIFRGIAVFFVLLVATSMMMDLFQMDFGTIDFFQKHGVFFLICITVFPRLTLLFSSVASGGLLWWASWIFCPRLLVATLATVAYFHTNPLLVTMSWLVAFGGEFMEKRGISRPGRFSFNVYRGGAAPVQPKPFVADQDNVIEAEFTKK